MNFFFDSRTYSVWPMVTRVILPRGCPKIAHKIAKFTRIHSKQAYVILETLIHKIINGFGTDGIHR